MAKHGVEVTLVYKHFPLTSIHDQALPAAQAAWTAQQQGQFRAFHDALFAEQANLGDELYRMIAQRLNLHLAQFERDRVRAVEAIQPDRIWPTPDDRCLCATGNQGRKNVGWVVEFSGFLLGLYSLYRA